MVDGGRNTPYKISISCSETIIKIVHARIYRPEKIVTNHSTSKQIAQIFMDLLEDPRYMDCYDLLLRL